MPYKMKGFPMLKGTGAMKAMKESAMKAMHASPKKAMKDPMKKMHDSPNKKMHDSATKKMHDGAMKKMHDGAMKAMKAPLKKMEGAMKAMDGAMKAMSPKKVFTGDKKKKDKKVDQGSFEPAFPGGDHSLADLKKMKTKEIMDYYGMDKKQVKNILKGKI